MDITLTMNERMLTGTGHTMMTETCPLDPPGNMRSTYLPMFKTHKHTWILDPPSVVPYHAFSVAAQHEPATEKVSTSGCGAHSKLDLYALALVSAY